MAAVPQQEEIKYRTGVLPSSGRLMHHAVSMPTHRMLTSLCMFPGLSFRLQRISRPMDRPKSRRRSFHRTVFVYRAQCVEVLPLRFADRLMTSRNVRKARGRLAARISRLLLLLATSASMGIRRSKRSMSVADVNKQSYCDPASSRPEVAFARQPINQVTCAMNDT
jgi:hypothetical protein